MDEALLVLVVGLSVVLGVSGASLSWLFLNIIRRRQQLLRRDQARSSPESVRKLSTFPSKNLFCSFIPRNQTRIESAGATPAPPCHPESDLENSIKLKELIGNSRMLFTIKEEEREGIESERSSMTERETKRRFSMAGSSAERVITVEFIDETTPFETPSTSPPYLTPLTSPPRNAEGGQEIPTAAVQIEI